MFNDESGKLEWFELKEIWYLTDGTMKILGSLPSGDFKCTTNRLFRLYETPEKFKDNNYYDVKCVYPSFNNVTAFRNSEATGCVYMFNDDGFVEKNLDNCVILYKDKEWFIYEDYKKPFDCELFDYLETARYCTDFASVDADKKETFHKSLRSVLALTDEQKEAVKQLDDAFKKCEELDVHLIHPTYNGRLYYYNGEVYKHWDIDYDYSGEGLYYENILNHIEVGFLADVSEEDSWVISPKN